MSKDLSHLNLGQLSELFRRDHSAISTYLDEVFALLERKEQILHTLIPEPDRELRLRKEAAQLLTKYPHPGMRPPLYGVLVGVKDIFNVDNMPTQAGSRIPPEAFLGEEAGLVSSLKQQGALILGKTVTTEFAYFNPGNTRNPLNPEHSPGGSSSGSAAAVAAGFCPVALGTQTIASIIRPASYCGIYGYKPSSGRLSTAGVFPFSQAADQVGYMCRHFDDLGFVAKQLIKDWRGSTAEIAPKLGVILGDFLAQADDACQRNYSIQVQKLREAGFEVVEYDPFPYLESINTLHKNLIAREFFHNHASLFAVHHKLYSKASRELYHYGESISEDELPLLQENQLFLRQRLSKMMKAQGIDLWLTPATTTIAPLGLASTGSPLMSLPFTHAGLPSLSIPSGFDSAGLAFGLQIVADHNQDEFLLKAAQKIHDQLSRQKV